MKTKTHCFRDGKGTEYFIQRQLTVATALALILAQDLLAFQPPKHDRLPDLDKRTELKEPSATVDTKVQGRAVAADAAQLRTRLPEAQVDFDQITGAPKFIRARNGFLTDEDGRGRAVNPTTLASFNAADPDRAIKAFLRDYRNLFGHGDEALAAARVKRDFVTPHSGLRTVVWQQELDGIEVFDAVFIAHTTRRGELVNVASGFLPDPAQAAEPDAARRAVLTAQPGIAAEEAVRTAAAKLGEPLDDVVPQPEDPDPSSNEKPAQPADRKQRFKSPKLTGNADVRLVWLPLDQQHLRLCWEVVMTSRGQGEMFRSLIDAETGELWLRRSLTAYISPATYRVFTSDSPSPFSPGHPTPLSTQPPVVSRSLLTLTALNTNASPNGWIDDGVNETRGNNVDAHTDRNNDDQPDLPRPQGSPARTFDFPLDLAQPPTSSSSAAVVQLFYWCNWMHDKLYELGFTEAAGNFQVNNFGRGGLGNDALSADAQDGGGTDNANMSTPPDGTPPRMQMYLFSGPNPNRDGDYDAEVVLHEYTHGLSNRRVGGGVGISQLQTAGMGEGWSDWYGMTLLSEAGDDINGNYATGGYLTYLLSPSMTQNYYFGIRRYPYSTDMTKNPLTFKDIDPGQASPHTGVPLSPLFDPWSAASAAEVHNQGEVWCVTLWEARANLIAKHGFNVGNQMILRLVTDGMNLSPANPNFIQARDAILQADRVNNGGANLHELWLAFAKRGMGNSAISPSSSTTAGVRESFDMPDDLVVTPLTDVSFRGTLGGPFTPASQVYTLTNNSTNLVVWTVVNSGGWLNVSPANGTLVPGAPAATLTVSIDSVANSFPPGVYADSVVFSNQVTHVSQTRYVTLTTGSTDYFTELFESSTNDLDNQMFTFTPDGSESFYSVCRQSAASFPTDPTGGTTVTLGDDSYAQVTLTGGATASLYGNRSNTFFIGSNGYLTQGRGDTAFSESLSAHFSLPRVSALFDDLNPGSGGTISWKQLTDRVAVTYLNVPEFGSSSISNSFQIELFFDGRIRLTYLKVGSTDGLVGLSRGTGIPEGFIGSDFSSYGPCGLSWSLVAPAGANENAGLLAGAGQVRLGQTLATNLTVALSSGDTTELLVTPSIVIPAGQTNAVFDLTVLDDTELDGTRIAAIRASAPGFNPISVPFRVYDNETAVLQLNLPATAREGDAPLAGTVAVSVAPTTAVVVELTSSDTSEIRVPPMVIIPAGQTSAGFMAGVMIDGILDGPSSAMVTAHVQNWTDSSVTVAVADADKAALLFYSPASAPENSGIVTNGAAVYLASTTPTNIPVTLVSSAPGQLAVPVTAVIPAGSYYQFFNLTFVDDALQNGDRVVTLTASAPGYTNAVANLTIVDDDTAPVILTQPESQAVEEGDTVALAVTASGGAPLRYQWRFNGVDQPGATATLLTFLTVSTNRAGDYSVVVTNRFGAVTSAVARVTVRPGISLPDALDTTNLTWTVSGNAGWKGQNLVTHDGVDAAASGTISANQTSSVSTVVVGPGTLTFWWRVSSEASFDYLRFYRAGALQASISGEVAWAQRSYTLPSGSQTLLWRYTKDGSVNSGQDKGWLDQVIFTPTGPPVILTQPQSQTATEGSNATFTVTATGLAPLRYQWRLNGTNISGATDTALTLVEVQASQAGSYSVRVTNSVGSAVSLNAALQLNHRPEANPQSVALNEDTEIAITLSGSDPDANTLAYGIVAAPAHGTLSGTPPNLTYRPAANYFGPDSFTFRAYDGYAFSTPATVNITVAPVPDAPVAFAQTVTLSEDHTTAITLVASDADGDALTYSFTSPAHGTLSGTAPNLVYHPATNYNGADGFAFQASDGFLTSAAATVSLVVLPENDPPVVRIRISPLANFPNVTNLTVIAPDGTNASLVLDGSQSSDVENDPLTYLWFDGTNAVASVVTATNLMATGPHAVTLQVNDGTETVSDTVTVDVLTPAESVGVVVLLVTDSKLDRASRHSLIVSLRAAMASFERDDPIPAVNQLQAFQNKVLAQAMPQDPRLARQLLEAAEIIIEAVEAR